MNITTNPILRRVYEKQHGREESSADDPERKIQHTYRYQRYSQLPTHQQQQRDHASAVLQPQANRKRQQSRRNRNETVKNRHFRIVLVLCTEGR